MQQHTRDCETLLLTPRRYIASGGNSEPCHEFYFPIATPRMQPNRRYRVRRLDPLPAGATHFRRKGANMSRSNVLSIAIGALIVAVAVLGYQVYQDRKEPKGVQINLGNGGLSIEKK